MPPKTTKTETEPNALVAAEQPGALADIGLMADMMADAGQGLEGTDRASYAIPFLTILQGLSPQLETVDAAKPGKFINTITDEVLSEVLVIPCAYQRRYLRWAPRSEGGGFKGEFNPVDVETNKVEGVTTNSEGRLVIGLDELKDTRNHFVLMQNGEGNWQPALLSLSSTQIKKSKRWMSRIQGIEMKAPNGKSFTPPSFSHIYKLTTVKEKNNKGEWYGLEVELVSPVSDPELYSRAKAFHAQVVAGEVEVQQPTQDAGADEGSF